MEKVNEQRRDSRSGEVKFLEWWDAEGFKYAPRATAASIWNAAVKAQGSESAGPVTQDGPLGGFAPVGPEATQLDFLLTQYQVQLQGAMDFHASDEESSYHDAEALKIKHQIIDRYTPRSMVTAPDEPSRTATLTEAARAVEAGVIVGSSIVRKRVVQQAVTIILALRDGRPRT